MPSVVPTHVVIDTACGTVYHHDVQGKLFTEESARRLAELGNSNMWVPTMRVYALSLVDGEYSNG